jgi:hypothetical protein
MCDRERREENTQVTDFGISKNLGESSIVLTSSSCINIRSSSACSWYSYNSLVVPQYSSCAACACRNKPSFIAPCTSDVGEKLTLVFRILSRMRCINMPQVARIVCSCMQLILVCALFAQVVIHLQCSCRSLGQRRV